MSSHACVTRRMLDDDRVEQLLQLGVRSVDAEEVAFAREHPDSDSTTSYGSYSGAVPNEKITVLAEA